MSGRTPGQVAYETFQAARWPGDPGTAWTHPAVANARGPWEAVAQAVVAYVADPAAKDNADEITRLRDRLAGLMPMGLRIDDADPVAVCLVGECKWHGHGDSMNDAVRAWTAHLAADHSRYDWPED